MLEDITKQNEEPLAIDQEEYSQIVELIYNQVDDIDIREEWLNYLQVATRREARNILFNLTR